MKYLHKFFCYIKKFNPKLSTSFPSPEIQQFDDERLMVPPWIKFPNLRRLSMGWRMGIGEAYKDDFRDWYISQIREVELKVRTKYPEPCEWKGYYLDLKKNV